MVRAWRICESDLDENKWETSNDDTRQLVDLETLRKKTGVLYWQV